MFPLVPHKGCTLAGHINLYGVNYHLLKLHYGKLTKQRYLPLGDLGFPIKNPIFFLVNLPFDSPKPCILL